MNHTELLRQALDALDRSADAGNGALKDALREALARSDTALADERAAFDEWFRARTKGLIGPAAQDELAHIYEYWTGWKTRAMIAATPQAVPAPAVPDGMVLVPREPTHEMLYAMAELDGWRKGDRDHPMFTRWRDYWNAALYAAPQAVPAPVVPADAALEPVLWAVTVDGRFQPHFCAKTRAGAEGLHDALRNETAPRDLKPMQIVALYAAPVVREPLTDQYLYLAWDSAGCPCPLDVFKAIARGVEKAHGITGGGK